MSIPDYQPPRASHSSAPRADPPEPPPPPWRWIIYELVTLQVVVFAVTGGWFWVQQYMLADAPWLEAHVIVWFARSNLVWLGISCVLCLGLGLVAMVRRSWDVFDLALLELLMAVLHAIAAAPWVTQWAAEGSLR